MHKTLMLLFKWHSGCVCVRVHVCEHARVCVCVWTQWGSAPGTNADASTGRDRRGQRSEVSCCSFWTRPEDLFLLGLGFLSVLPHFHFIYYLFGSHFFFLILFFHAPSLIRIPSWRPVSDGFLSYCGLIFAFTLVQCPTSQIWTDFQYYSWNPNWFISLNMWGLCQLDQ